MGAQGGQAGQVHKGRRWGQPATGSWCGVNGCALGGAAVRAVSAVQMVLQFPGLCSETTDVLISGHFSAKERVDVNVSQPHWTLFYQMYNRGASVPGTGRRVGSNLHPCCSPAGSPGSPALSEHSTKLLSLVNVPSSRK